MSRIKEAVRDPARSARDLAAGIITPSLENILGFEFMSLE